MSTHFCGKTDAVEVVLRTIISVNQLSVYGAIADMCDELTSRISDCSESTGRPVAELKSEDILVPTDLSTTFKPLLTNESEQGDLLREYERKFSNLPDNIRFIRLCSEAGFMKTVAIGQYFETLDDTELTKLDDSCREYIFPGDDQLIEVKRMDPWKHEDRSSIGGSCQLPSRPLQESNPYWTMDLIHGL